MASDKHPPELQPSLHKCSQPLRGFEKAHRHLYKWQQTENKKETSSIHRTGAAFTGAFTERHILTIEVLCRMHCRVSASCHDVIDL